MLKLKALVAAGFVAAVSLLPAPVAAQNQQTIPQVTVSGTLFRWTGLTLGSKNAGTIALVDGSGNHMVGQQLAASSMPVVLTAAQLSTLTPPAAITGFATSTKQSDGSHKTQIVDGSGNVIASTSNNLNVQCANCSGSGVSTADGATFTASASLFAGTGGFFQTTATNNALTNGQQGMWQMTANRAGFVNMRNASGTEVGTSAAEIFIGGRGTAGSAAGGVLTVQGSASGTAIPVSIASVPSHAVTNAGTFATQAASATAPVSTMNSASGNAGINAASAFVFDDVSPTAITENNFGFARMSANRNVYQTIRDAAGNERGANVDASNRLTTAPSLVSGSVASGAYASGALASGSIASGAMVDIGAQADSVCGSDTGTCSLIALQKRNNAQLTAVGTSPLPAQTGIGNVNIGAVQSAGSAYETVAASQTAQALGATGATGDYLSHCVIYPATTSPGVVTVFDNANAAATNVIAFAGGATSTSNLTPISVPVGAISTAGAWKVTTGTNVSVTCYGKFT